VQSWFRHCDPGYAFFWESDLQPAGRRHGEGEGPVQYLADTPEGAWAELIRHEHLELAEDLADVRRSLWSIAVLEEEVEGAGGTGRRQGPRAIRRAGKPDRASRRRPRPATAAPVGKGLLPERQPTLDR